LKQVRSAGAQAVLDGFFCGMARRIFTTEARRTRRPIQTLIFPRITRIDADISKLLKTLLAVVAIRKRCSGAFWRNPTANTACVVCCVPAQGFSSRFVLISAHWWLKSSPNPRSSAPSAGKLVFISVHSRFSKQDQWFWLLFSVSFESLWLITSTRQGGQRPIVEAAAE
jgi:hypothetical protein